MSAIVDCCGGWDFSIPDRSQRVLDQNRRQAVLSGDDAVTVGPRRDAHEFAEAGAEGAQGGEADGEADLRDREIAAADERHGPFDSAGHEKGVRVRGLAERRLELATEVAGGHVLGRGESLDAQRSVEFTVDAVTDPPQSDQLLSHPASTPWRSVRPRKKSGWRIDWTIMMAAPRRGTPMPRTKTSATPKTDEPEPESGSSESIAVVTKMTSRVTPPISGSRNRKKNVRAEVNRVRRKYQMQARPVMP